MPKPPSHDRAPASADAQLKAAAYFILLAIADGASHGTAIRDRALSLSGGQVKLWPTTLYGTMRELLEAGLLADRAESLSPVDDARRRCYRLTNVGEETLRQETRRLEAMVAHALTITDAP